MPLLGTPLRLAVAVVMIAAFSGSAWGVYEGTLQFSRMVVFRPGGVVTAAKQGPDGRLWVATSDGLMGFDGERFEGVTLPGQGAARQSSTALAAGHGLVLTSVGDQGEVFALKHGRWTAVAKTGCRINALAITGPTTSVAGGACGLFEVPLGLGGQGAVVTVARNVEVKALLVEGRATRGPPRLWVGSSSGLGVVEGDGYAKVWSGDAVLSLAWSGATSQLLLGTSNGGVWGLRNGDIAPRSLAWPHEETITALHEGDGGLIWVGMTFGLGSITWAGADPEAHRGLSGQALPRQYVHGLASDSEGNLWLCNGMGGLILLPRRRPLWAPVEKHRRTAFSVAGAPDGSVWALLSDRLIHFRNGAQEASYLAPSVPFGARSLHVLADGRLLIGSLRSGLHVLAPGADRAQPVPGPWGQGSLIRVLGAHEGVVWLADGQGRAFTMNDAEIASVEFAEAAGAAPIRDLAAFSDMGDARALVLATAGGGLLLRRGGSWQRLDPGDHEALAHVTEVESCDGETVAVATAANGLWFYRNGKLGSVRSAALPHALAALACDKFGNLWISSSRGVHRLAFRGLVDATAEDQSADFPVTAFSSEDGLPSDEGVCCFPPSAAQDGNGGLWITGVRGPVVFPNPGTADVPPVPPIVITRITLDGRPVDEQQGGVNHWRMQDGFLEISYALPLFTDRRRVRFRHRLLGADGAWRSTNTTQPIVFGSLGPGRYDLEIEALAGDGHAASSRSVRVLRFVLQPPFYRTTLFRITLAAAGLIILSAGWLWRVRLLRSRFTALNRERDRIAREIHDSLEQSLYAARLQLQVPRVGEAGIDDFRRATENSLGLIDRAIQETRAAVWALRTGTMTGADLATAISTRAGELLQGSGIRFSLRTIGAPFSLPGQVQWNIARAAGEAILNAMKHSQAQGIEATITFERHLVGVEITDDGVGFSPERRIAGPERGYGIQGMAERIEGLGGTVEARDREGGGTTVRIQIPRPKDD